MRNRIVISILALVTILALSSVAMAQKGSAPPPGWLACPRCQTQQDRAEARAQYKVDGHPFDPHDLSGVWGYDGVELDLKTLPPLTPFGKQLYDATKGEEGRDGKPLYNSKDGMLRCDPLGYPRLFTYNYGFEFAHLPGKVVQFFEWGHTWRTIYTDGRKLPENPPEDRWLGYSVGRWEGNTFVVESNGYDDRSWLAEDFRDRKWGFPHTNEMKIEERYTRTSYGVLDASLTVIDPKVYTKPWTTTGKIILGPGAELWEYFCVPSDSEEYNSRILIPTAHSEEK